jgi:hypothetical protein
MIRQRQAAGESPGHADAVGVPEPNVASQLSVIPDNPDHSPGCPPKTLVSAIWIVTPVWLVGSTQTIYRGSTKGYHRQKCVAGCGIIATHSAA